MTETDWLDFLNQVFGARGAMTDESARQNRSWAQELFAQQNSRSLVEYQQQQMAMARCMGSAFQDIGNALGNYVPTPVIDCEPWKRWLIRPSETIRANGFFPTRLEWLTIAAALTLVWILI